MSVKTLVLCGIALCHIPTVAASAQPPHAASTLRIGLWTLWHDKKVVVSPSKEETSTIKLCHASGICTSIDFKQPINLRANADQLLAAGQGSASSVLLTGSEDLAAHGEALTLHHPLRISARNGELVLAVTLPIETYVERVVASESGPEDSAESLKALAIVVRSYALHVKHGHTDYDLCDSTHCQLLHWSSSSARSAAAHQATLATSGETLWFHNQRAAAWFHQDCGGHTASPTEVWPSNRMSQATHAALPWLPSQVDNYCTTKGARQWSTTLSISDLTKALAGAGLTPPGWKTLTVSDRGPSGRAVRLRVGETEIAAEAFRLAVGRAFGWGKILSTWFEISSQPSSQGNAGEAQFIFHGRGSGHGVGLCQAGSAVMALQRRDAQQILAHYFPGANVADESTGHQLQNFTTQNFSLQTVDPSDQNYLPPLSNAFARAMTVSGLHPTSTITLRTFASTPAFRSATGAPGWVAAFTEGNFIALQPLKSLAAGKLLVHLATHEFLHALIEEHAAPDAPLWFREGIVEALIESRSGPAQASQPAPSASSTEPNSTLAKINRQLAHAGTEADSQAAHRAAAHYAQALLQRYGREQVLDWLHSGLPPSAIASLR